MGADLRGGYTGDRPRRPRSGPPQGAPGGAAVAAQCSKRPVFPAKGPKLRSHPGVPAAADPALRIALVEPEIPGNTGSVGRLAMAAACPLHLVEPLGFQVDDRHLRRAGMDYWKTAEVYYHDSFEAMVADTGGPRIYLLSSHAVPSYTAIPFRRGDMIVFGRESVGLDAALLARYADRCYRIPMWNSARSLNLANAVSIVLYEGLRQLGCLDGPA